MLKTVTRIATTAGLVIAAFTSAPPSAHAETCPDVEVVFARGTGAAPGIGALGQAFVDSLTEQAPSKKIGVYAVNYPAGIDFAHSSTLGANDASAHLQAMVAECPGTELVLGGFSQGANVIELVTGTDGAAWGNPVSLPPSVADHVAAVVLFGNPSRKNGRASFTQTNALYGSKSIDLCAIGDPVCSNGVNLPVHGAYVQVGAATEAATFAARRL